MKKNSKYTAQLKKQADYRSRGELKQLNFSLTSKNHDLIDMIKLVPGANKNIKLRNILEFYLSNK